MGKWFDIVQVHECKRDGKIDEKYINKYYISYFLLKKMKKKRRKKQEFTTREKKRYEMCVRACVREWVWVSMCLHHKTINKMFVFVYASTQDTAAYIDEENLSLETLYSTGTNTLFIHSQNEERKKKRFDLFNIYWWLIPIQQSSMHVQCVICHYWCIHACAFNLCQAKCTHKT